MIKKFIALIPLLSKISALLSFIGFALAAIYITTSPLDYQQGLLVKILYLHVPCAWLSLLCYGAMAICSALLLLTNNNFYGACSKSLCLIGANFTALTLICGALWGSQSWGTWWVWDVRLVSELILLFIYLALLSLHRSFNNLHKADFACAIFCLIGFIDLPIIKFSIKWWNSLHQGSTISIHSHIDSIMLHSLLWSFFALSFFALTLFLLNLKLELLARANYLRKLKLTRLVYQRKIT